MKIITVTHLSQRSKLSESEKESEHDDDDDDDDDESQNDEETTNAKSKVILQKLLWFNTYAFH
jgi:hypothetical protein